jgi:hypothetical protein
VSAAQLVAQEFEGVGEEPLQQALHEMRLLLKALPLRENQLGALAFGFAKILQEPRVLSVKDAGVKHALKIL